MLPDPVSDTAPLKTVPLMDFAHRMFTALTDAELFIGISLAATVVFAADRLAGVIG